MDRMNGINRILLQIILLLGFLAHTAFANPPPQTLVSSGDFIKIYDPSVGENTNWYINDHCFVRAQDGTWHMFGITHAEPAKPEDEIHFAHATAKTLLQQPWDKQPFALDVAREAPWNETHLWAPEIVFHDGLYYMFYCAGGSDHAKSEIHLATSSDLETWTRSPHNPMVVDGFDARDPFVLRLGNSHDSKIADRGHEPGRQDARPTKRFMGEWVMYYTATSKPAGGNHIVACVTSHDLLKWNRRQIVFSDPSIGTYGGPTESPFVVHRGDAYYLFIGPRGGYDGTDVFLSHDPFHWDIANKVGHIPAHAAEVVQDTDGKWYISRAGWGRGGLYLAPLVWKEGLMD